MHKINLESNNIRLDLVNDIDVKELSIDTIDDKYKIERVTINEKNCRKYNKRKGEYISILFDDITDKDSKDKVILLFSKELKRLLINKNLFGKNTFIVGLGNSYSTPDSLGPKVIKDIIPTRHISLISTLDKNFSVVSKIAPGVFANTGIETFDIIKSITNRIKPDYVIIIDSLCSKSLNKLNKVIQITDSGIDPGSGVGNHRKEISKKTLGVDVIAIGVPTVVNLHTIIKDTLDEYELDSILNNKENNYLVTLKEIDFIIEQLSYVISKSINNTLHNLTK